MRSPDEVLANPGLMEGNPGVPVIISDAFGIPLEYVLDMMDGMPAFEEGQSVPGMTGILVMAHGQDYDLEGIEMDDLMVGASAAAEYLEMETAQLMTQLPSKFNS